MKKVGFFCCCLVAVGKPCVLLAAHGCKSKGEGGREHGFACAGWYSVNVLKVVDKKLLLLNATN